MRLTLRSLRLFVLTPVLAAAAAFTTSSASAEVFHVPFAFTAGNKALPAGQYRVIRDEAMNSVTLLDSQSRTIAQWILEPGEPAPGSSAVLMRFAHAGGDYALRNIQYRGAMTGRIDKKLKHSEDRPLHVIRGE